MPNWKKVITSGSDASLNTLSVGNGAHVTGSLNVYKSGSTVFNIEGSQGQLFSVTDELSGSLFSVNDISGIPIFEVFSDDTVKIGTFGSEAVVVEGDVLKLSQLSNQSSEATAVVINGSNVVGTRELGSNAFTSTTIPTNVSELTNDSAYYSAGDSATFYGLGVGDPSALNPAGTATNPAIIFANSASTTNNGIYSANSSTINISTAGTQRATFNGNGLKINNGALGVNVNASTTDGRIDAGNDIVAFSSSDRRWKENIKPIDNALNKILKIGGYEFDWKELSEEERKTQHGNEGHDVGVIAQEVEEVLPEVVTTRENGFKGVKYDKMVALLIEGMKEQQSQIEELKSEISKLKGEG